MALPDQQAEASTSQIQEQRIIVHKRTVDDLPSHVKGSIVWIQDKDPGYCLPIKDTVNNVEFLNDHWYFIDQDINDLSVYYTFPSWQIGRHTQGTGYWDLDDPQHPDNRQPSFSIGSEPQSALTQSSAAPSPITGTSFTTPRARADTLESTNSDEAKESSSEEPSPQSPEDATVVDPELQLDTEIVTAAVTHAFSLDDREPATPFDPNYPGQLAAVEGAVIQGVDPPPFPPLLTEEYNQNLLQAATQINIPNVQQLLIHIPPQIQYPPVQHIQPQVYQQIMAGQGQQQQQKKNPNPAPITNGSLRGKE